MPVNVKVADGFFDRASRTKTSVLECLKDLQAYRFKRGVDFREKGTIKNFILRVKMWGRENGLGIKAKADTDGTVIVQAYELTDEDRKERAKMSALAKSKLEERKMAKAIEEEAAAA